MSFRKAVWALPTVPNRRNTLSLYSVRYRFIWHIYTNPMEQSRPWGASSHSASSDIPGLLWKPRVHYSVKSWLWVFKIELKRLIVKWDINKDFRR
jgi:hypothetical protein